MFRERWLSRRSFGSRPRTERNGAGHLVETLGLAPGGWPTACFAHAFRFLRSRGSGRGSELSRSPVLAWSGGRRYWRLPGVAFVARRNVWIRAGCPDFSFDPAGRSARSTRLRSSCRDGSGRAEGFFEQGAAFTTQDTADCGRIHSPRSTRTHVVGSLGLRRRLPGERSRKCPEQLIASSRPNVGGAEGAEAAMKDARCVHHDRCAALYPTATAATMRSFLAAQFVLSGTVSSREFSPRWWRGSQASSHWICPLGRLSRPARKRRRFHPWRAPGQLPSHARHSCDKTIFWIEQSTGGGCARDPSPTGIPLVT